MRALVAALLVLAASALAQDTTNVCVWSPARVLDGGTSTWAGTNTLQCTAWIPEIGITNATNIGWFVTAGLGGGGTCSVALYNDTGATKIIAVDNVDCSATGVAAATVTAFSLTAGTKYQVCTCENTNGGTFLATKSVAGSLTTLQNGQSVPIGTTAANACTAGVTPATTGVLTAAAVNAPIVLICTDHTTTSTTTTSTSSTTTTT